MDPMRFLLLAPLSFAAEFPAPERSTAPIAIVYPAEGAALGNVEGEWVAGAIADPTGRLQLNGQPVSVYKTGGFLAFVPVQPGTFTLIASLVLPDGTTHALQRSVSIATPQVPLPPAPLRIDEASLSPRHDQELRDGDWLLVKMKATPGQKAEFRLAKGPWQPMRESNPALGIYEGAYWVKPGEEAGPATIEYRVGGRFGNAEARGAARVALTAGTPAIAALKGAGPFVVRTGPGEGELFYAPGGTRFVTGGRVGAETEVLLAAGQTGWVDTRNLEFLLPGAHPPRAETDTVTVRGEKDSTIVRISLGDRVPFVVEESDEGDALVVRVHYAYAHTNWIVYGASDRLVRDLRLKQESSDLVSVTVRLKPGLSLWGWHAQFEGNALRLELRHPPKLKSRGSALAGVKVFLDPGHMPSAPGAIGPTGTREMDANFAIAKAVEELLLDEDAVPLLSRAGPDDEVALADRPKAAWEKRADLFVSIHNNNLPSGRNPFKGAPHGFSVFYYHPHSRELARALHDAYKKRVPLPSEELRYGNLLVARLTGMPAALTESAYMTYPEHEELLLDFKFRKKLAQAIVDGLRAFLEGERRRQKLHKEEDS